MNARFEENPIITTKDIRPSRPDMVVECVLNPGVFVFEEKIWMILRIAERPEQEEGYISFPILTEQNNLEILHFKLDDPDLDTSDARIVRYRGKTYLSTISHLRIVCSEDGVHFYEPDDLSTSFFGQGALERYGIEDCRVSKIEGRYYLTYTQVSENGVGVGLMHTADWQDIKREGMIFPPHNKDCCLFEEKIDGQYVALHRPSGLDLGGNFIWIATSPDLIHWGHHSCLAKTRPDSWDSARIGAGAAPIKTSKGWLEIYHGADANHTYCLGALLLDLKDPTKVIGRSVKPLLKPEKQYETMGFFGNVVFTNGHVVSGDELTVYYGASDEVICGVRFSIEAILESIVTEDVPAFSEIINN